MKSFWTVCQMDGVSNRMWRVFIVKLLQKKTVNMFEHKEIREKNYEVVI